MCAKGTFSQKRSHLYTAILYSKKNWWSKSLVKTHYYKIDEKTLANEASSEIILATMYYTTSLHESASD